MKPVWWKLLTILITSLALLSSCDMEYRTEDSATISFSSEAGLDVDSVHLFLSVGQNAILYREYETRGMEDVRIPSLFFDTYTVQASAYNSNGVISATGSGTLTVEDGGENSTTIELVPVSDSGYTGRVSIPVSWTNGDEDYPVTSIALFSGDKLIARQEVEEGSEGSMTFECELSGRQDDSVHFVLYSGDTPIQESNSFTITVNSGSTTVVETPVEMAVEQVLVVRDFTLSFSTTAVGGIDYSFTVPDCDFSSVVIQYADSQAVYWLEIPKDGDYSGTVRNLASGADYHFEAWLKFADGSVSPSVSSTLSSPIALRSVSIRRPDGSLQPGDKGTFTLTYNPADATDLGGQWSSSNPSVIMIGQDGSFTVMGFGQSTIGYTANNGNRRASIAVNIALEAPVLAAEATQDSIELSWSASESSDRFELYRTVDGRQEQPIILDGGTRSYTDRDLESGSTYSYSLRAVNLLSGVYSWSNTTEGMTIGNPVITIVIPGPRESIDIEVEGNLTTGSTIDIELSDITGLVSRQWLINGSAVTEEEDIARTFSYEIPEESEFYLGGIRNQELTLVLGDSNGQKYSASLTVRYMLEGETLNTDNAK